MPDQLRVMISSTARDLPEHRKEAMDACLRQGMFPIMMEYLAASDDEAISASLKMVDEADIYLLILAHRYGYVPKANNPKRVSITEMEYDRAIERRIRRAVFIVDKTKPLADFTIDDIDTGGNATKLKTFKQRLELENIVNYFKSPEDLRAHVINSLSQHRRPDLTAFHYVSDIPEPPEIYVAHPYTLLQTHRLIGRQSELGLLTDWITGKELKVDDHKAPADSVRIMSVVAIGGMGKSALTWKWFNDVAPQEMKNLAGRMWWSFYESDATFENFVARALAYVTKRPLDEVEHIPAPERETQLLAALDHQPFLLVLDGLERILIAYARLDAARLDDSDLGKDKSIRKTADPKVGSFLKKLAQVKQSRVLVSSYLYPVELETGGGDPIPGCFRIEIEGLIDEDAVELWRAFGVSGSRDELLPVFNTVAKHPLLIQALAGEIKRYRKAPGDFKEWRKANPSFDPTRFPDLKRAMAHVLEFALRGLDKKSRRTLHVIAAFKMPTTLDTLTAVLVNERGASYEAPMAKLLTKKVKPFDKSEELDETLSQLEDRGLLGWDKRANRYDLHAIVRKVVWSSLRDGARHAIYTDLFTHFKSVNMIEDHLKVNRLEDLRPAIELYSTLIGLRRYDDAGVLFYERLDKALRHRLNEIPLLIELLEKLFPDGLDKPPSLTRLESQIATLNALGLGYQLSGKPEWAIQLLRRGVAICKEMGHETGLSRGLGSLSNALLPSGALYEAEYEARRALILTRGLTNALTQDDLHTEVVTGRGVMTREELKSYLEGVSLTRLGMTMSARGIAKDSACCLYRSLAIDCLVQDKQAQAVDNYYLAERALWFGEYSLALKFADEAAVLVESSRYQRDMIRVSQVYGNAALGLNESERAHEMIRNALTGAREVNLVEQKLPALVALAKLRRRQGDAKAARELLEDVWEAAERGPYPLFHADAFNVLAQIERDEGNNDAAIEAATKAYRLAWCDGPPFAYHWGLEKAKQHLKELGAPEPEMPPFDESKFEPMPEVEIDPHDEFHVGDLNEN